MAGDGEGVDARHDADGKEPGEVRNDDEHEEREDQRHEPAAIGADIGAERVVDEAVDAYDRRLPAARHQRGRARSATHEDPDEAEGGDAPTGGIGTAKIE